MTNLETKVLEAIIGSNFNAGNGIAGEELIGNAIWADSILDALADDGVAPASRGGAIASCTKKGFVNFWEDDDGDLIALTREGFDAAAKAGIDLS